MRKALAALALALPLGALAGTPAFADVSTTQHLPAAACNPGTMNAHDNIPETTGTGATTPGHNPWRSTIPPPRFPFGSTRRWVLV